MGGYLIIINKLEHLDWRSKFLQRTDAQNDDYFFSCLFSDNLLIFPGIHYQTNPLTLLLLLGDTTFWRTQNERGSRHHGYPCFFPNPAFHKSMDRSIPFRCAKDEHLRRHARVLDKERSPRGKKRAFPCVVLFRLGGRYYYLFLSFVFEMGPASGDPRRVSLIGNGLETR